MTTFLQTGFRFSLVMMLLMVACTSKEKAVQPEVVLIGLDGKEYFQPERSAESQAKLDSSLAVAQRNIETDSSEENFIWLGRRLAYLYRYKEAIDVFSKGLEKYPDSYKLFRHRGHRYITVRDYARAVADLQQAAALMPALPLEIEPDGQPNKLNIPLSSTQFNVWYHLGLAHYLKGDFESAAMTYNKCMEASNNDDLVTATADWLYMTYRRMNLTNEAAKVLTLVRDSMNIIENDSYYLRLRMYQGKISPDSVLNMNTAQEDIDLALATQGYGVGNWYLCSADTAKAKEIFKKVVSGKHFAAFGFIAAEAELVRLNSK
jgi:tetratricopeptide (TPR) repeat protein